MAAAAAVGVVVSAYSWKPIELPVNPPALARERLSGYADLWRTQRERLKGTESAERFMDRMVRLWSIETGIIERLYDVSEGATQLLVQQGFDAALLSHNDASIAPDELIRVLEDHQQAIDFAMDIVGGTRPLSVSWIKEVHALLTRHQRNTTGRLPDGRLVEIELRRGEFKQRPNNPSGKEGTHEYCPPSQVAAQMDQLISLYEQLPNLPDVRSAWLHHAFTQIHPFQDGNGRVARVLASIDFIKAGLFPLVVHRTGKAAYLDALRDADEGDLAPLVQLFGESQERMLLRAISESVQVDRNAASLQTVLHAARDKTLARKRQSDEARSALVSRISGLAEVAEEIFNDRAGLIEREMDGVRVRAYRSKAESHHWYREQIIALARQHEYWADLKEPRRWARLDLRNGEKTELVVSLHHVGNPTPGAAVATAFVTHRAKDKKVGENLPFATAAEPFLLTSEEDEAVQKLRFINWLEPAIVQGLAIWVRYL